QKAVGTAGTFPWRHAVDGAKQVSLLSFNYGISQTQVAGVTERKGLLDQIARTEFRPGRCAGIHAVQRLSKGHLQHWRRIGLGIGRQCGWWISFGAVTAITPRPSGRSHGLASTLVLQHTQTNSPIARRLS